MKRVFFLLGFVLLSIGYGVSQSAVYFKLVEVPATKGGADLRVGSVVPLSELSLAKDLTTRFAVSPEAVSIGLRMDRSTYGLFRLDCHDSSRMDALLQELNADPNVEYAEPMPVRRIFAEPPTGKATVNDPYYVDPNVQGLDLRWHLDMIRTSEAWDICAGRPEIKVAVIDNAVWAEHEDLQIDPANQYNAMTGAASSSPVGIDNTQDCSEEEFYDGACAVYNWSHGTHCAGLIGAINNNGVGIASLASGITLMGVHCGANAGDDIVNTAEGLAWAVENGARVVNLSFGSMESSRTEQAIISAAAKQGVVFVAAAGNDGVGSVMYPAGYREVIAVGSCDYTGGISYFSNYGAWVDILAPGGYGPDKQRQDGIFSTTFATSQDLRFWGYSAFTGKHYDRMIGTSMASPILSSVVALMLSYDSTLDYRDVRAILMGSAQPSLTSGIIENSGIVDAAAALRAVKAYVTPYELSSLQDFNIIKEAGNKIPALYWAFDAAAEKPVGLRLYRDNVLLADHIVPDAAIPFYDSTARGGVVHCYEVCEVDAGGKESYRIKKLLAMPAQCNIYLTAEPAEGGTVRGGGIYEQGSSITIVAKANPGYKFDYWDISGRVFSEKDSMVATVGASTRVTARFSREAANEPYAVDRLEIVPNPVSSSFVLAGEAATRVEEVRLCSLDGKVLKQWKHHRGRSFDVSDLTSGLYMVWTKGPDGEHTVKLLKR